MTTLPKIPSALIRLAIADLEAVEKDSRYVVCMNDWHIPDPMGCHVCLAGAVMAKTIGAPIDEFAFPNLADNCTSQLVALNDFREGNLESGLDELNIESSRFKPTVRVTSYSKRNSSKFKADMLSMAAQFERAGL